MSDDEDELMREGDDTLRMTADIVASFVANNKITPEQLTDLIRSVHRTVGSLSQGGAEKLQEKPKPAIPINRSVNPDYIVCLEDGKKLKMLKRYLRSTYGMT